MSSDRAVGYRGAPLRRRQAPERSRVWDQIW